MESNSAQMWHYLLAIPSVFQRLVFLASLHDAEACEQFCRRFVLSENDPATFEAALWTQHHQIFEEWLGLDLMKKLADLEMYASGTGESVAEVARQRLMPERRDRLIPRGTSSTEQRLFHGDVELLLAIIFAEDA